MNISVRQLVPGANPSSDIPSSAQGCDKQNRRMTNLTCEAGTSVLELARQNVRGRSRAVVDFGEAATSRSSFGCAIKKASAVRPL